MRYTHTRGEPTQIGLYNSQQYKIYLFRYCPYVCQVRVTLLLDMPDTNICRSLYRFMVVRCWLQRPNTNLSNENFRRRWPQIPGTNERDISFGLTNSSPGPSVYLISYKLPSSAIFNSGTGGDWTITSRGGVTSPFGPSYLTPGLIETKSGVDGGSPFYDVLQHQGDLVCLRVSGRLETT